MIEEQKLPQGWIWTTAEQVCAVVTDGTHDTPSYVTEGIPLVTSKNLKEGTIDFSTAKNISLEDHQQINIRSGVENGDILFAMIGTIGNPVVVKTERAFSIKNVGLFKKNLSIMDPYYLQYWLSSRGFNKIIENNQLLKGTTQKFIPLGNLRALPVPLAPLTEQHRIVEAIEQQFSRLDAGIASLRSAQKKLKLYRASVLKAAVEGELTAEWRAANPPTEPASVLLERILKERRERWEEEQRAKGKDPKKQRYVEPAVPNVGELPQLLNGWCWATLEMVCDKIQDGSHFSPKVQYDVPGKGRYPYITAKNIKENGLDLTNVTYVDYSFHKPIYERCNPEVGDVLLTKDGVKTGISTINTLNNEFSLLSSVALLKTNKKLLNAYYLKHYLNSPFGYKMITGEMTGTAIKRIVLNKIYISPIPLAPLTEQQQIATILEERLSIISDLEATIKKALKRAELQRQSILHQAFTGKLVPQDPDDEPASVLLERIQQERDQSSKKVKGNSHGAARKRTVRKEEPVRVQEAQVEPIDTRSLVQQGLW